MPNFVILGSCRYEPYKILAMPNKNVGTGDKTLYDRDHEKAYELAFKNVFKKAIEDADIVFVYAPNGIGEHTKRDGDYAILVNRLSGKCKSRIIVIEKDYVYEVDPNSPCFEWSEK